MKLDERDRGRILLLAVLTLLALPMIWLVNRSDDDSARPNVAAVGLDPGEPGPEPEAATAPASAEQIDPMGTSGAAYLAPTPTAEQSTPEVVYGTVSGEAVGMAVATYRHNIGRDVCLYNGTDLGARVTIVNVANGRSTECTTSYLSGGTTSELVMDSQRFATIADLVSAPVHVEVRR